ncbi:MAG: prolyl oligopeptidase family serine peptidase [Saprospiraceae bacterium]|nr:prolyl oligopeptidase family serine peptidase [Saprospiraceae bacterium]
MKRIIICLIAASFFFSCKNENKEEVKFEKIEVTYPETKTGEVKDNYHGVEIADPYRWLEDDNSEETMDWVNRQNSVTQDFLYNIQYREYIKKRLEKLWDYEKYGSPFKEGDSYYYFKNDGLQNQYVLYGAKNMKDEGEVVLDPNKFSEDGTSSLGSMSFDESGKYLGYMVSEGGSDWRTGFIKDLSTGEVMEDRLEWIKFSGFSWKGDGFYYSRFPTPKEGDELSASNTHHSLYYHKVGDDQANDKLIYVDNENPMRNVYAQSSEDERFLILNMSESTSGNELAFIDLDNDAEKIIKVVEGFDSDYSFIDNNGDELLFTTNNDAPKQKVISIDSKNPSKENWKTIIPESDDPLRGISIVGNKMFASYMHNASSQVKVFDLNGKYLQDLKLPGIGSGGGVSGKKSDKIGFYSFTSFTRPSTIYMLNTETMESEIFRQPTVDFDSDSYETKQEWFTSKDGTKIPMFITMRKGLKLDGKRPTLLYGYGGFDISITPSFSLTRLPLLENDGVYVVANIRGGGEFGKEWHKAGTKGQKQNVFDDFIGAAEFLIENNYTSSEKLAIEGGSNGGLLVGASMTQRPDLFAVAFPRVGVLDMLRYHEFTIGHFWATDYGRSDNPEDFEYLIKYSPLHNVKETAYPATMVMTADHDDRVVPAHSFKFGAELQSKHNGDAPVLVRIEKSAGHGAGKPTAKIIEEASDAIGFMFYNMNEPYSKKVKG